MNDIIDKLILRIIFALVVILILFLYRFAHTFIYPQSKEYLFKNFSPIQNPANIIHFFSRLLGIGIIFSSLYFNLDYGILFSIFAFVFQSLFCLLLFFSSIYLLKSVCLYSFEYSDEIIKRKNLSYAIIDFSIVISSALLLEKSIESSLYATSSLIYLWLMSNVSFGVAIKFFKFFSNLNFNRLLLNKNIALAFSFSGYLFGWMLILNSSMSKKIVRIDQYTLQLILKILLSSIIFPLIKKGITTVYGLNESKNFLQRQKNDDSFSPTVGHGVFEGAIFLTASFLATMVTGHIIFGKFYR